MGRGERSDSVGLRFSNCGRGIVPDCAMLEAVAVSFLGHKIVIEMSLTCVSLLRIIARAGDGGELVAGYTA
jgi:hypothetical protein